MSRVWTDENKFQWMYWVERYVAQSSAKLGIIPQDAADAIMNARVDVKRIREIELTTRHETVAFINQLSESVDSRYGAYIHYGLTSSDVLDTALALQILESLNLVNLQLIRLTAELNELAVEHAGTVMMGRTHSVHAEPTTFGFKVAGWVAELSRDYERLRQVEDTIKVGKISGPVGTFAHLPPEVETSVLKLLGLKAEPFATQVVARDRHAQLLTTIAIIGGSIERFANEIRNLSHTEINELREGFSAGQRGSSAMPHKKNPIKSEQLVGLSRLLRGYALAGLENQALWHERDMSHSSVERIAIADSISLLYYMLVEFRAIIRGLVVNAVAMADNVANPRTESLTMDGLILQGLTRESAYEEARRGPENLSFDLSHAIKHTQNISERILND